MPQPLNEDARIAMAQLLLPEFRATLARDPKEAGTLFYEIHPADGADILSSLEEEEVLALLEHLTITMTAQLMKWTEPSAAHRHLRGLPADRVADIFEEMDPDDGAELLSKFEEDRQIEVLRKMEQEDREEAEELLSHAEQTAGRLMNPQYLAVPIQSTAADALEIARRGAREGGNVHSLYVVDEFEKLRGRLTLIDVLAADPEALVSALADESPITVQVDTDQEEVARIISKYDLIAVPVLDSDRTLAGIVTVDDVVDVLIEEGTEDVQKLGAVQPLENPYFETGFWELLRKRGLWLTFLFLVTMYTGTILQRSEDVLSATLSLVLFVPLIIASGGNTGAQSATIVTRALATGEVRLPDALRVASRELWMGLALGTILATIGFARALFWKTGADVALVVSITLVGVCILGTMLGAMLPMLLQRMKIDPAMASSPFVASIVDVSGILLYMTVATAIL